MDTVAGKEGTVKAWRDGKARILREEGVGNVTPPQRRRLRDNRRALPRSAAR